MGRNQTLTSLWLFGNDSSDEGAAHLAAALRSCRLTSLGLEMNEIHTTGAEALAYALSLEHCPLSLLRLQHNPLGDGGVTALARALYNNRSLTKLQLRDTGVSAVGCAELAKVIPQHKALHDIGLEQNELPPTVTDSLLRAMRVSSSLATLSLDLQHGGEYSKQQTADELMKKYTISKLAGKKKIL
uniref:Uncharacterized protein n=1 Tax=Haptolina brevifila TaxID=156173 RepID=A0A7S2D1G9_9EUKA